MEIDVASVGIIEQNTSPTHQSGLEHRRQSHHLVPPSTDRKRKNTDSSSTALKSILRHRTDLASGSSSFSHKLRRKRAVRFTLEEKSDEVRKWNGKRLRYLALDLDRWDNLPYSAFRTINKQKTRHTKRLKCCHSNEDLTENKAARPQMDDGASPPKDRDSDMKEESKKNGQLIPETVPEMESIEKSFFVSRWLQHQNARSMDKDPENNTSNVVINTQNVLPTFCFGVPGSIKNPFSFGEAGTSITQVSLSNPGFCGTPSSLDGSHTAVSPVSLPISRPQGNPVSCTPTPTPAVSLGAPQTHVTLVSPSVTPSFPAPAHPTPTNSLLSLAVNFHTLSLKSCRRQE